MIKRILHILAYFGGSPWAHSKYPCGSKYKSTMLDVCIGAVIICILLLAVTNIIPYEVIGRKGYAGAVYDSTVRAFINVSLDFLAIIYTIGFVGVHVIKFGGKLADKEL